jgi:hypothetical protein
VKPLVLILSGTYAYAAQQCADGCKRAGAYAGSSQVGQGLRVLHVVEVQHDLFWRLSHWHAVAGMLICETVSAQSF